MYGVACQEDAAVRIAFGDRTAPRPDTGTEPLNLEREAERAAQIRLAVNSLCRQTGTGVEQHETPHGIHRIDDPNVRPGAVTIDRDEERGRPATAGLKQIRSAK